MLVHGVFTAVMFLAGRPPLAALERSVIFVFAIASDVALVASLHVTVEAGNVPALVSTVPFVNAGQSSSLPALCCVLLRPTSAATLFIH